MTVHIRGGQRLFAGCPWVAWLSFWRDPSVHPSEGKRTVKPPRGRKSSPLPKSSWKMPRASLGTSSYLRPEPWQGLGDPSSAVAGNGEWQLRESGEVEGNRDPGGQWESVWYPEASSQPGWAGHTTQFMPAFLLTGSSPEAAHSL